VSTRATLELNDEEKKKGLLPYSGKDGSDGIQTVIGTYCIQRLELFHELVHFKYAFYTGLQGEVERQIKTNEECVKAFNSAQKSCKGHVKDPDLRPLTEKLFGRLKDVFIQMEYNNFKHLTERARNMENQVAYDVDQLKFV